MYLHIGNGITVRKKSIIGIFDLDSSTVSAVTKRYINKNEKEGNIIYGDSDLPRTFVLHEAPHKLIGTLTDLKETLGGERRLALCREMTKLNEQVQRFTLDGALEHYLENAPRGEYVLVIEGASQINGGEPDMTPKEAIEYYQASGMTKKEAIKAAARLLGLPKNEVYRESIDE